MQISVVTRYENNRGNVDNVHNLAADELSTRIVDYIDISNDALPEHKYKENEDPKHVKSLKTSRGPLLNKWQDSSNPIMCSYKIVRVKFEVWGLQTRVESYAQKTIRDVLLLAHRQAFAWTDEWYDLSYEKIVEYERETYARTNDKVLLNNSIHDNNNNDLEEEENKN